MKKVMTVEGITLYYRDTKPREGNKFILALKFDKGIPKVTTYNNIQQVHFSSGDLWCPMSIKKYNELAIENGKYISLTIKG